MDARGRLPLSLPAFLLAPVPVPLVASALFALGAGGKSPLMLFLFCFGAGLVVSFLGTAGLVACLWVIARARPVTKTLTILTGTALGILGCLCFTYINWHASGPDSGPPTETMLSYFLRNWNDPFLAAFVFGGFFTALIYDLIARRFSRVEPRTA